MKWQAHKKYKFDTKIGLIVTYKTLIINAIKSLKGNPHNSKTIAPLFERQQNNVNFFAKELIYDRRGKGKNKLGQTTISTPNYKPLKRDTAYQKSVKRKKFRRRAAIEPTIGHLKSDFRME